MRRATREGGASKGAHEASCGTIEQAAAYPDAILAEIADFLSAHSEFLDRYLTAAGGDGIDEVPDDAQPG